MDLVEAAPEGLLEEIKKKHLAGRIRDLGSARPMTKSD
jgi:hypothetical protein